MKKFLLTLFSVGMIMTTFAVPPVLANDASIMNTANWSWTMSYRYVNGKDNGQTHDMNSGTMTLIGTLAITSSHPGAVSPFTVTYEVKEDRGFWLPDRSVGTTGATPPINNDPVGVYGHFGTQDAGTYYITAWTTEQDGHTKSSSGILRTN